MVVFLPKLGVAFGVFVVFWIAAKIASQGVTRIGQKSNLNDDVVRLFSRSVKIILLIFGTITALGTLGMNVSALVAGLGLTGFALGFALKDAVSNVLAGTLILIYQPFKRGDKIAVGKFEGQVSVIDLRYTTIVCEDRRILIPNSNLFTNAITIFEPS